MPPPSDPPLSQVWPGQLPTFPTGQPHRAQANTRPGGGGNGDGGGGGGGGNGGGPGDSIQDIYGPKKLKTWKDVVALNIDEGSAYKTRALEKLLFEDLPDTCVGNRAWDISQVLP